MLHVWNMYLHLAHIYGKSIGKCSIHEAYADLNRPSYPRQDAFWVAPNASGRCHQWYRQFVLTSNRCNSNPMICMINIYIYIMVWQMTWGYIERMIENSIHVVKKHGARERNPSHISALKTATETWRAWVYSRAGDLPGHLQVLKGSVRRGGLRWLPR